MLFRSMMHGMHDATFTPITVHGIAALRIERDGLAVTVTTGMGPRVLAFGRAGGPNLLAELPDLRIEIPGVADYPLLGGHRLWSTPEVPPVTYRTDGAAVAVTRHADGVDLQAPDDPVQGVAKRIGVRIADGALELEHELRACGTGPLETAPWAITQVPPRGEAWLPTAMGDLHGKWLPNRALVLWPYSSVADPRLTLGDDLVVVRGVAGAQGRVKVGTQRTRGWIAWRDGGTLLVVETAQEAGSFGDMGASLQCYSCGDFVELETLGPVVRLAPGETVVHRQRWRIHDVDPAASASDVIASLGLASEVGLSG